MFYSGKSSAALSNNSFGVLVSFAVSTLLSKKNEKGLYDDFSIAIPSSSDCGFGLAFDNSNLR